MTYYHLLQRIYTRLIKPVLFGLAPEQAHDLFIQIGKLIQLLPGGQWTIRNLYSYQSPKQLSQTIASLTFLNPVGLSAGFDKDGYLHDLMPDVGFGFTQVGSVTALPYVGNPPPRATRLIADRGIIVNYGLKNEGIVTISKRLKRDISYRIPTFISVAKTNCDATTKQQAGIDDYLSTLQTIKQTDIGSAYTINISCPNTFGGEPFTTPEKLEALLTAIDTLSLSKPIFIKLPLELHRETFRTLLDICIQHQITGVILSNLKKDRSSGITTPDIDELPGGISGLPMKHAVRKLVGQTYQYVDGQLIIIGVGGVFSAQDAYILIKQGASLVQLITGMIYQGPQLIGQINRGLVDLLRSDGYTHISQAIGANHR